MTGLKGTKDYVVEKSLEATYAVLQALDDSEEIRSIYTDATVFRTADSFAREDDLLHVDIREDSALSRYIDELECPSPFEILTGGDLEDELTADKLEVEGLAEGLYSIFEGSDAERILIYSDDGQYFGPSTGGIASMEVMRKMEEERNIHWRTDSYGEDYLWEELFGMREKDLWSNWLEQRPDSFGNSER